MKLKLRTKLMMIAVIPCILVSILMVGGTWTSIRNNMTAEISETLRATAFSLSHEDVQNNLQDYKNELDIDVTVFDDNVRVATTVPNAIGTKCDPTIYKHVKEGNEYFSTNAKVNGKDYFGYYIPLYDADNNFVGMTFAGKPTEDANNAITRAISLLLSSTGAVILGVIVIVLLIANYMTKLVRNSTDLIAEVSSGNFTVVADKKVSNDEIGEIYKQAGMLAVSLRNTILSIKEIAGQLNDMSGSMSEATNTISLNTDEISRAVEDIAQGALTQTENIQDASHNMGSVNDMVLAVQKQVTELNSVSETMQNIEKEVVEYIETLKRLNVSTNEELSKVEDKVSRTAEDIESIQRATDIIRDIANKTSLLSLNASIEASHAGDAGKGFAVVASEVSKLADQSESASKEIEGILQNLKLNYQDVITSVSTLAENMDTQSKSIEETHERILVLDGNINNITKSIGFIETSCEEVKSVSGVVVEAFTSLSAISEENSAGCEETNASVEELNSLVAEVNTEATSLSEISKGMVEKVDIFKV